MTISVASAFSDPDGDALTYAAESSAPGVATVAVSGADVTVTGVSAGTAVITVTASDPGGLSAQQAFQATVPNRAPAATDSVPGQSVRAGASVTLDLAGHFSDPDGDALSYTAESSAPDVATVAVSGASLTITGVSGGTAAITVTASDPGGLSAQQAFHATVPNRAPAATDSVPGQSVRAGASVTLDLAGHFSDPDGDALSYTAESSAPDVATVAVSGASLTITGVSGGTATVTVTASDPGGLSAQQAFEATVPNRAPVAADSIPGQPVRAGASLTLDLAGHFSDPDGDALS
ncbi:MAG: Ig-like domain-containing protein, partial [Acidobacteriota bacterium]|nr:Ig-like domain-containing protein [Acidobacteriota bacterium]